MALVYFDRVQQVSLSTGTGAYTLDQLVPGFQSFTVITAGNTCYYCAADVDSNAIPIGAWEIGIGHVVAGTPATLVRDQILTSTNSNAAVSWTAGTRRIFLVEPASDIANLARLNAANAFTQDQNIVKAQAGVVLNGTDQPADTHLWRIVVGNVPSGTLYIQALNDAMTVMQGGLTLERNGSLGAALLDAGALNRGTIPDARLAPRYKCQLASYQAQAYNPGQDAIFIYWGVPFDLGGAPSFDNNRHGLVCQRSGIYYCHASMSGWVGGPYTYVHCIINVNGGSSRLCAYGGGATGNAYIGLHPNGMIQLNAGDVVTVTFLQNGVGANNYDATLEFHELW